MHISQWCSEARSTPMVMEGAMTLTFHCRSRCEWKGAKLRSDRGIQNPFIIGSDLELPPGFKETS